MELNRLVDSFVARVNSSRRDREFLEDVPALLRIRSDDPEDDDLTTAWQIVSAEHSARVSHLESRLGGRFPPSFRDLISRYSFPAFEYGPIMLFANTGQALFWELESRLFTDPVMSPFLLRAGFIQIGNPMFYSYDPICVEFQPAGKEGRVVRIDHEAILCNGDLVIIDTVALSFERLLESLTAC